MFKRCQKSGCDVTYKGREEGTFLLRGPATVHDVSVTSVIANRKSSRLSLFLLCAIMTDRNWNCIIITYNMLSIQKQVFREVTIQHSLQLAKEFQCVLVIRSFSVRTMKYCLVLWIRLRKWNTYFIGLEKRLLNSVIS